MQQIQQQISLYHTLFYVCLGLCIFFFLLSLVFFFKFNIRNIFNARTGRSVKKTVQDMEAKNAHTGQLRRPPGRGYTGTLSRTGALGKSAGAGRSGSLNRSGGLDKSGGLTPSKRLARVRKADMEELVQPPSRPTEPLEHTNPVGASMETQVLSPEQLMPTLEQVQQEADQSQVMFRIEKYTMLIHTDEVV